MKKQCSSMAHPYKKIVSILLLMCICCLCLYANAAPGVSINLQPSQIDAPCAALLDKETGKLLFEKSAHERQYPASTVKLITLWLALEHTDDLDMKVIITPASRINEIGSRDLGLKTDEEIPLIDLLYGMILYSGNDAAKAVAIHIAGTEEAFVKLMNEKVALLNLKNTHFVNSHGLHDPDQYTSAYDLGMLMRAALGNPMFREIINTYKYTAEPTNKAAEKREWTNENRLINPDPTARYSYAGTIGGKTGYTSDTLHTFAVAAQREGLGLIAVVLRDGQQQKWTDSIKLFEYGFANYLSLDLQKNLVDEQSLTIDIPNAKQTDLQGGKLVLSPVFAQEECIITDSIERIQAIQQRLGEVTVQTIPALENIRAPLMKDSIVAEITYHLDDEVLLRGKLVASRDVLVDDTLSPSINAPDQTFFSLYPPWIYWTGGSGILLIFIAAVVCIIRYQQKKRRRWYRRRRSSNKFY